MSKRSIQTALRAIVSDVSSLRGEAQEHSKVYSSILVRLSILVAQGAPMVTETGEDWRDWAVAQCKGFGPEGGDLSPSTAYRLRNAGAVAAVLGDAIGDASYLALVPLYRFLASAKSEEETTAAEEAIRGMWAQASKGPKSPTAETVLSLVEKAKSGTRGKSGADAETRKAKATAKAKRSRNTPTETTETQDSETDPGARDACRSALHRILSKYDAETVPQVLVAMAAAVKLAETHGVSVASALIAEEARTVRKSARKSS